MAEFAYGRISVFYSTGGVYVGRGFLFRTPSKFGRSYFVLNGRRHFVFAPIGAKAN